MKIIVTQRADDIHVSVEGQPGVWGCGKSMYSAIGNLVSAHKTLFNVEEIVSK